MERAGIEGGEGILLLYSRPVMDWARVQQDIPQPPQVLRIYLWNFGFTQKKQEFGKIINWQVSVELLNKPIRRPSCPENFAQIHSCYTSIYNVLRLLCFSFWYNLVSTSLISNQKDLANFCRLAKRYLQFSLIERCPGKYKDKLSAVLYRA